MHNYRQRAGRFDAKALWLHFADGFTLSPVATICLLLGSLAALGQTSTLNATLTPEQTESTVSVNPPGLNFPFQLVGTTSAGKILTFTNNGSADIYFTNIFLEGADANDFPFTTTCAVNGAGLGPGESCTSTFYYSPSFAGEELAFQIYEGNFTELEVSIEGKGTAVFVKPKSLTFPNTTVGTTSAPLTIKFGNVGPSALPISSIVWFGKPYFSQTNTCGSSVAAHSYCTFSVSFSPLTAGTFSATLSIGDSDPSGPQQIRVVGTGVAASPAD